MWTLVTFGIEFLEALFVVGMVGSALVIVLSGVEDVETMFEMGDDQPH